MALDGVFRPIGSRCLMGSGLVHCPTLRLVSFIEYHSSEDDGVDDSIAVGQMNREP